MADSKWSEQKEKQTKNYLLRRKTSEVGRTFKSLLGNPLEITDKPIEKKIINGLLDIKIGQFMEDEFDRLE